MKQIKKIKTKDSEFVFEEVWSSIVMPSFSSFLIRNGFSIEKSNELLIKNDLLIDLKNVFLDSLRTLLQNYYSEPSLKELQKHSTRFEKINLDGKIYKVNYRMSTNGRSAYAIYSLVKFIDDAIIKGSDILIESDY